MSIHSRRFALAAAGVMSLISLPAQAFPWDIDMVDAVFLRAYEFEMRLPPEGSIPTTAPLAVSSVTPDIAIPRRTLYREACEPTCYKPDETVAYLDRNTAEGQALTNPFAPDDEEMLAVGEKMFAVYCQTCHGAAGAGGAPVADHDPTKGRYRYPAAPPMLQGEGNSSKIRSDGYIFLTIRNGGAVMPSYSYGMSDEEIWAVVGYIRTLPDAQYQGS